MPCWTAKSLLEYSFIVGMQSGCQKTGVSLKWSSYYIKPSLQTKCNLINPKLFLTWVFQTLKICCFPCEICQIGVILCHRISVFVNSYSASHDNWCTGTLWNRIMTAQCEGMGEVGSARYEPALLPPCPSIRVLRYSNCQRSTHSSRWAWQCKC